MLARSGTFSELNASDPGTENISRSLAEQLGITDIDIQERKDLLGFSRDDETELRSFNEISYRIAQAVVDEFYVNQTAVPHIRSLIGDTETLQRLRSAMREYIITLFQGSYGAEYVNSRLRIGKVHARIGVPPKLYVSSLYVLECILNKHIAQTNKGEAPSEALRRLLSFDLQFVFDTYIQGLVSEVQLARNELIEYSRSLEKKVAERTQLIERLALMDDLTGLGNRRAFFASVTQELKAAKRRKGRLSLLFADLDGFKLINDTEGHVAGDQILKGIGELIGEVANSSEAAFRYGGDEFCVLLPGAGIATATEFGTRLRERVKNDFRGKVMISIGVVSAGPEDFPDVDAFIASADAEMYQDKHQESPRTPVAVKS
ncbi:GGDEF domain-containing protein [Pseudophaeobacter sp.]|uniref:GGDEF domain-containing protein n=1 Tax=Pseudophaeobacter sp. TaxID=1971739 RepID=UPI0032970C2D